MITGIVDMPLLVNIRPRKTRHGGTAVKILDEVKDEKEYNAAMLASGELIPMIHQKITLDDYKIIYNVKNVKIKLTPCALLNCYKDGDFSLLINLNNGNIVRELENGTGVQLSLQKTNLTPKESRIFSITLNLKRFTAAELFSRSGANFSEVYDMLNLLTQKGYLSKEDHTYEINRKFEFLTDLRELRVYEKIDYGKIDYTEKLEKTFNIEELKDILGKFVKLKDHKECYLVLYE